MLTSVLAKEWDCAVALAGLEMYVFESCDLGRREEELRLTLIAE